MSTKKKSMAVHKSQTSKSDLVLCVEKLEQDAAFYKAECRQLTLYVNRLSRTNKLLRRKLDALKQRHHYG